ncbi:MAG: hypothetical protein JO100_16005 [Pseudonocardia sp.]|nr:hypothetical protein [Pseudonocardia sp.]
MRPLLDISKLAAVITAAFLAPWMVALAISLWSPPISGFSASDGDGGTSGSALAERPVPSRRICRASARCAAVQYLRCGCPSASGSMTT